MFKKRIILILTIFILVFSLINVVVANENTTDIMSDIDDESNLATQNDDVLSKLPTTTKTYDTRIDVKEYEANYNGNTLQKDLIIYVYNNETDSKNSNTAPGNLTLDFNKKQDTFSTDDIHHSDTLYHISWDVKAPKVGEYECKFTYQGYTRETTYKNYILKEIYKPSSISFKLTFEHKPQISIYTNDIRARRGDEVNISASIISSKDYYDFGRIVAKIDDIEYNLTKSEYIKYGDFYKYNVTGTCVFNTLFTKPYSLICYPYGDYKNNSAIFWATIKTKLPSLEVNVTQNDLILGNYMTKIDIKVINPETDKFGGYYLFVDYPPFEKIKSYNANYSLKLDKNNMTSITIETKKLGLNQYRVYYTNLEDHVYYYFNVTLSQQTNINVNTITAQRNSQTDLIAYVKNNINENIDGGSINFIIDGITYKAEVKNGKATVKIKTPSKVGVSNYIIKYTSDSKYTFESSGTIKIISKCGTKIAVKSVTGYQGKKVKLKATVKDEFGNKIRKGTVVFNINGNTYKSNVKNGVAYITIKYPKAKFWKTKSKTKGNYLYETNYYKSTTNCNVQFKPIGDYLGSSSTFKVTTKKKNPVKHKYKINKYRTIIVPVKNGKKVITKGSVQVITKKFDSGTQNVLYVCAIKDNDFMTHYVQIHSKKNGKWTWANWLKLNKRYDGQFEYGVYTYGYGIKADKIKVKYYDNHIQKFINTISAFKI